MIKVMIERRIAEGLETHYENFVSEALQNISSVPGYISGESLKNSGQPNHHVLISSWQSTHAWEKWANSEKRKYFKDQIMPLLIDEEKFTIFEPQH